MIVDLYNNGTNSNRIDAILNINKNPQFYHKTVQRILADQGIIESQNRKPVNQRIKTYHKDDKVSVVI
jgi:hypothetical protein